MKFIIYNSFSSDNKVMGYVDAPSGEIAQQIAEQQFPEHKGLRVILDYKAIRSSQRCITRI